MCKEKHVLIKNVYKWTKLFNEELINIQDENRLVRPTITSTPVMVGSVNASILDNRIITKGDISEQLNFCEYSTTK